MTKKRAQILDSALEMFSTHGFSMSSTAKIAKNAAVSEALIFRHFTNKEGLLDALIEQGNQMVEDYVAHLTSIEDASERLENMIDIANEMSEENRKFWKLIYSLKWQSEEHGNTVSESMKALCKSTLKELGYKKPKIETEVFMILMDGLMTAVLLRKPKKLSAIVHAVKAQYGLTED